MYKQEPKVDAQIQKALTALNRAAELLEDWSDDDLDYPHDVQTLTSDQTLIYAALRVLSPYERSHE